MLCKALTAVQRNERMLIYLCSTSITVAGTHIIAMVSERSVFILILL